MNNRNKEKNSSVYPCLVVNKLSLASVVFSVIFQDFISDKSSIYHSHRNSGWQIKWFSAFQVAGFRKYDLRRSVLRPVWNETTADLYKTLLFSVAEFKVNLNVCLCTSTLPTAHLENSPSLFLMNKLMDWKIGHFHARPITSWKKA